MTNGVFVRMAILESVLASRNAPTKTQNVKRRQSVHERGENMTKRILVLEDGTVFEGKAFGTDIDNRRKIV